MQTTSISTVKVTRQSDAHGAHCQDCGAVYTLDNSPYWHWSKSAAMHRSGSGHKVGYFRIVLP